MLKPKKRQLSSTIMLSHKEIWICLKCWISDNNIKKWERETLILGLIQSQSLQNQSLARTDKYFYSSLSTM